MTLATVWHYWIAVAIAVPTVLAVIAAGLWYVVKVSKPRYPQA
jgi:hypothetical protein